MELTAGFEHFVRTEEPLAQYTGLKLGGSAEYFAEPTSVDELAAVVKRSRELNIPTRVLGGGSNLLINDDGVPGLVIYLHHPTFSQIEVAGNRLTAGGGAKLSHVISTAVGQGLAGLEGLAGVPGTIGGALHGNAGGNGVDIGHRTVEATVMTRAGEILTRTASDLHFTYRQSSLDELVILNGVFELEPTDSQELTRRMQKFWIVQKASQPGGSERMGYLFFDPPGLSASSLIEQAGLKGTKVGGAEICPEHTNFVIASSDATASDVVRLAQLVQGRVKEVTGMDLTCQLTIW
ncbi:UDP-N-acetylmuramate dehydrogenase [Blastopirellula marina]|uniref:UDP-N-acetylenolpyruvoylglucosamine reductase n=1 Tax=Blastopirellula marina TaxID=124 RepID=A0A2S8G0X9_9BACT|nr:UDP-N-acetylmuramate dehydrogenase [Blastopirellula marina]PQO37911.1 UDP-N-acetylenolpyruvoylglucosamine reductase [Blastopirellula marina]PTL44567.1 UDP-N-acetylmuramate dehydrogenase [Blastopirellula marina]